jgi:hypothetical protein
MGVASTPTFLQHGVAIRQQVEDAMAGDGIHAVRSERQVPGIRTNPSETRPVEPRGARPAPGAPQHAPGEVDTDD